MTKGGPHDGDPVLDLNEILVDEGEPSASSEAQPIAPPSRPSGGPPSPPPLPKRSAALRAPSTTAQPAFDNAVVLPSPVGRPTGDPFQEPAEPRLPRGLPEEKLDYFRTVLKQKQETLARARAIYAERDAEVDQLRDAAQALRGQLQAALAELERLKDLPAKLDQISQQYERANARAEERESRLALADQKAAGLEVDLQAAVEERKQLSKALAEVEIQVPELNDRLGLERKACAAAVAELAEVKASLQAVEEKLAEVSAAKFEAEGSLDAVNEQYQTVSADNERLTSELEGAQEELKTAVAERDAAAAERDSQGGDLEALNARIEELEQEAKSARGRAEEQAARLAQQAQEQARREIRQSQERTGRALEQAQASAASSAAELEQARAQLSRLQGERSQLKAQAEQHIRKLRDELTATTQRKIAELQTALMEEEEKRAELERRLSEAHGKSAALEGQLGSARTEQATARKARDELATIQHRAMELQGLLQKERRERDAWEKRTAAAESNKKELEARIDVLESAIAHVKSEPPRRSPGASGGASDELIAERDQLKADLASMKKKLVAAETAMEAAASLRAKVVRLEAQLKGKK